MRKRPTKYSVPATILMLLVVTIVISPYYIMLVGAFKPNIALIKIPIDLTPFTSFTLANANIVFGESEVFLWIQNSLIISASVAIGCIFIGISAGYAFAKIRFRGRNFFFALVMATMMMPKQMLMIPNYLVARSLNLQDTLHGVILTTMAPAFGVFLSRQTISSMPSELFDAAEIDGCGELRKFFRIVLPLTLPTVGTIGILAFFPAFNDYVWQLIMISSKKLKTLPVGLSYFSGLQVNNKAAQLAMALIATLPLAILFIACQKFFIKDVTAGAVKG